MRVLWLSHFVPYPPTGHGALQRSHQLLKEAASRHEVHLAAVSPPQAFSSPAALDEARKALGAMAASVAAFPLPAGRFGSRRAVALAQSLVAGDSVWERLFWSPALMRHLHELVRRVRFDVAHVDAVFLARYVPALRGIPVVLNHHNLESHLLLRRAESHSSAAGRAFFRLEARKVARLERSLIPRAAGNVVVSELDGERLQEVAPGTPVTVVANGVDVEFFRAAGRAEPVPQSLVFAGGMDWFPNREAIQFLARELWPALVRDDPARRLTVVGRHPPPEIVEAAGRDARVRVTGFVDDVRAHIEAAQIYLCPIRVGGGTRLKILDALAMERPLVATGMAVEGLGMEDGAHYLRAETPDEFVAQVGRLERNPDLRRRLAAAGRAFVEAHYSWRRIGAALDEAYAAAADRRRAADSPAGA